MKDLCNPSIYELCSVRSHWDENLDVPNFKHSKIQSKPGRKKSPERSEKAILLLHVYRLLKAADGDSMTHYKHVIGYSTKATGVE